MKEIKSFSASDLARKRVLKLKPYQSARDEFSDTTSAMTFMDANENPLGDPDLYRYPDPHLTTLREKLSEVKNVDPSHILLGNGSDELFDLIFRVFCEPEKDDVIITPPTYGMYEVLATINAVSVRAIVMDDDFQPKVEEILQQQSKTTKLLFLCSPNNPTGTIISQENMVRLLNGFSGIVVLDEAYIDFSTTESWIHQLHEFPNLIVTQTFSKAWGLAGIRLGVCYASTEIISLLHKIKPPYNVNSLTQQKALAALTNKNRVEGYKASIIKEREELLKQLLQLKYVEKIVPSEANFLLVKVDDAKKRYSQLIDNGIVVRYRGNQPLCENGLRITVGTSEENKKLIETLQKLDR
ncbi:histidinol-phosphate transaminase [Luteirhabdus pelagi]|uniref:histidinol-phosphate transaminase n=1 Tax=Luteirhabdus pelagi TaxID=2792783 RepID=UPI00193AB09E|nr:histidinol-phosphate transaminase [Luteirhabdus pelagi]